MPEHTQRHEQNRTSEASKSAQQQAGCEAGLRQTRDQSRELAHLRDKVAVLQQDVTNRHTQERQDLEDQHQDKRQELMNDQTERPEVTESRAADRMVELSTLDRFQDTQRAQLAQRQQFEQQVCQELAQSIAELAARQQQEKENLQQRANEAGPNADRTFDNERQQFEVRQQQERALMEASVKKELQALRDDREKVQVQMDRDQGALQRALFEERPSAEHQRALREVLANQEAAQREFLAERRKHELQRAPEASPSADSSLKGERRQQQVHEKTVPQQLEQRAVQERVQAATEHEHQVRQQTEPELHQRAPKIRLSVDHTSDIERQQEARQQREPESRQRAQQARPSSDRALDNERQQAEVRQQQAHAQTVQQQQLEQRIGQEQDQAAAKLQARQQKELEELQRRIGQAGPSPDRTLDNHRQQLEARHQQEPAQLEACIQAQFGQIAQLQQLQQRVLEEQNKAMADLQAQHRAEMEGLQTYATEAGPGADRTLDSQHRQLEARQQQERQQFDAYVQTQREQMAKLQRLYQQISQAQIRAVADLQARQQPETELQLRAQETITSADRTGADERRQAEARLGQERAQLVAQFEEQLQTLEDHRDQVQAQMGHDRRAFQQVLYDRRPGSDRQEALARVLATQEAAYRKYEQILQRQLAGLQHPREAAARAAARLDLFQHYSKLSRDIEHFKDLKKGTAKFNRGVKELYPFGSRGDVVSPDLRLDAHHIIEEEAYRYFAEDFKRLGFKSPEDMPAVAIPYEAHIRSPRQLLDSTKEWKSLTKELKEQIDPAKYETLEDLINAYEDYYKKTAWREKLTKFFENLLDCYKEARIWEPQMAAAQAVTDELKAQAAVDEFKRKKQKKV